MEKLLFTRREVAALIGLSVASVEALTKSRQLKTVKVGRSVRIHVNDLQEFARKGTPSRTTHGKELHEVWQGKRAE
jgi:excisionase family DNA binding protein